MTLTPIGPAESLRGHPRIWPAVEPETGETVLTDGSQPLWAWTVLWEADRDYAIEQLVRAGAQVDSLCRTYNY